MHARDHGAPRSRCRAQSGPPADVHSIPSTSLITEFRNGNMVVLVTTTRNRENEGDLVMAAAHATPEAINFMARYGRGLICLPMTRERCDAIGLKLMVGDNREAQRTQFTVSIDAARGDHHGHLRRGRAPPRSSPRPRPDATPADFVQPGHVFPLMSEPGGVLTRAGHTEAGCDLARLAGLEPASVLVEILNEDGTMARRPDLERFAQTHGLRLGTIADLIKYRMLHEKTVERAGECRLPTEFGEFPARRLPREDRRTDPLRARGRRDRPRCANAHPGPRSRLALRSHRQPAPREPDGRLAMRSPESPRRDAGSWSCCGLPSPRTRSSHGSMPTAAKTKATRSRSTTPGADLRTFGLGAQILADLGVRKMPGAERAEAPARHLRLRPGGDRVRRRA